MYEVIKSKYPLMNVQVIRNALINQAVVEGEQAKQEFERLVAPWEGDKPTFSIITDIVNGSLIVRVEPGGTEHGMNKFKWLDKGTSIRWAVMGRGFVRKSHPHSMRVNPGRNIVRIRGRRAMEMAGIPAKPGIESRDWSETIRRGRATFGAKIFFALKAALRALHILK